VSSGLNSKPYDLLAPRDPLLIEMAAASSAALGLLASPTMVQEWAPGDKHPLDNCWPLGFETLGSPMLVEGYTLPTGEAALTATTDASNILYRYMDGALADNTNAAMTLGRMQADCKTSGGVGCENGYRMIVSCDNCQKTLFYNPSVPPGTFIGPKDGGFNGPIPTIFAEAQPQDSDFKLYASADLYHNGTKSDAYYWHGFLTTVANEWFGVSGGDKVELLYFTGIYDTMVVAGVDSEELFSDFYAPSAVAQASGAAPVIQAFLDGTL
jgi:hypothetical protein